MHPRESPPSPNAGVNGQSFSPGVVTESHVHPDGQIEPPPQGIFGARHVPPSVDGTQDSAPFEETEQSRSFSHVKVGPQELPEQGTAQGGTQSRSELVTTHWEVPSPVELQDFSSAV